jgi:predicted phosphoadenosine phosphosulfate sulfurtransferase
MKKYNHNKNVYQAAMERIAYLFTEFEQIVISFSGGKDSGVMMNLALEYARKTNQLGKVAVYHLDYEAQYQMTTDYVNRTFAKLPTEIKQFWFCLPIKAQCSTSMFQSYWQPWKLDEKEKWCRKLPTHCISEDNFPFSFEYEVSDYEFNKKFAKAISRTKKTCFFIGIRTQESLHRYKAVNKFSDKNEYKSKNYTTKITENVINAYPIYDWLADDIWIANAMFAYDYNKLYDLMYQAGLTIHQMRVASPFNDAATESLKLYKAIDPNNWGKLIGRVNGVNFTGLYGGTTAMGWNTITKPKHFTWKEYMYFLLDTLPEDIKQNYLRKLKTSFVYWLEKGGALPVDTVKELDSSLEYENLGNPTNNRNYTTEYQVIKFKEYLDEIDIKNPNLLPTYKRMCIAIMKNDTSCKTLGFGQTKAEFARRKKIINKYKSIL